MNKIDAKFPPTIFYTKQNDCDVQNDFYFTIETNCSIQKDIPSEQKTPKIYIKGLEQLFSSESSMEAFAKSFQASSNVDDWSIKYECFRDTQELCLVAEYSLDPEASSIPENIFPVAFRSVQEKFQFTADFSKFSDKDPIGIQVYFDDFDFLSSELKDKIGPQEYTINVNEIAYILDFYAKYTKNAKDPQAPKVHAIHKGEEAEIGWDLGDVHKVSASLYDENGYQVANLPFTYNAKIDRDRKFTLSVEKDGHVETRSMTVYRTLWEKVAEVDSSSLPEGFKPDPKGNNKFFYRNSDRKYYTYIHPKLFRSANLAEWEEVTIQTLYKPQDNFKNYFCSYYYKNSTTDDCLLICYTYNKTVNLYEYNFNSNILSEIKVLPSNDCKSCQAIKKDDIIDFFSIDENKVTNFDLKTKTGILYHGPSDSKIIAADTLFFDNKTLLAILCNNNRVYVYDTDNKCINNIFEFKNKEQKRITLVQTNSIYIVLDNYTFELNDKEKFTDLHFTPKNLDEASMIIGARDQFVFSAIIRIKEKKQKTSNLNIWNYSF